MPTQGSPHGGLYSRIAPDLGQTETAGAGDPMGVQRVQRLASLGPCPGKSTSCIGDVQGMFQPRLNTKYATGDRIPYKKNMWCFNNYYNYYIPWTTLVWYCFGDFQPVFEGQTGHFLGECTRDAISETHHPGHTVGSRRKLGVVNYIVGWQFLWEKMGERAFAGNGDFPTKDDPPSLPWKRGCSPTILWGYNETNNSWGATL